jgi:hypothetical protein
MKSIPYLHAMPRVSRDIERCIAFIGRQPWGKPADRERDILQGIARAQLNPEANHQEIWRPEAGIWLRLCSAAQFVIVYTYLPGTADVPQGLVSIRAVQHSRTKDVFEGVKESTSVYSSMTS